MFLYESKKNKVHFMKAGEVNPIEMCVIWNA